MKNVDMKFKNLEELVLKLKGITSEMFTAEEKEGSFIVWSEYRENEGLGSEYGYGDEKYKIGNFEECIDLYIDYIKDRIIDDEAYMHFDKIIEEDLDAGIEEEYEEGFYIKKDDLEIVTESFC